jgi:5-methylcytosine-specific restriction endonuclease McrA
MRGPVAAVRAVFVALRRARGADAAGRANRARGTHCFYCGVEFRGDGKRARTIDHRIPRARGGTDALANLVFACQACNGRKADIAEDTFVASEWLQRRRDELAYGASGGEGSLDRPPRRPPPE